MHHSSKTPLHDKYGLITRHITTETFVDFLTSDGIHIQPALLEELYYILTPNRLWGERPMLDVEVLDDIITMIESNGGTNYMRGEIGSALNSLMLFYERQRLYNHPFPSHTLQIFHDAWSNELSRRIDWLIKYRVAVSICNGDMRIPSKRVVICKAIFTERVDAGFKGVFSRELEPYEVPSNLNMIDRRRFVTKRKCSKMLNHHIVAPYLSDWYANDINLGISLTSNMSYDEDDRGSYPIGTMYIFMPSTTAMENYEVAYEKAHMALYLSRSAVELDDVLIYRMTKMIEKRRRADDIILPITQQNG